MLARPAALLIPFALGAAAGAIGLAAATRAPRAADCPAAVSAAVTADTRTPGAPAPGPAPDPDPVLAPPPDADPTARSADADARIARAEAAEREAQRAVQREAEARAAAERRRAHEALQTTALSLASDVQAWTLKPAAFGGGAGSLDGLTLGDLGRRTDARGRYETVDGVFTLTVSDDRATLRGAHRRFSDLTTTAIVEITDHGTGLVVDGRDYGGAQVR